MVAKRVVYVEPGSEIDQILTDAGDRQVTLEWHGRQLRIVQDSKDQQAAYDPDRVQENIRRIIGLWQDLDVETFKIEILEEREQGSMGRPAS